MTCDCVIQWSGWLTSIALYPVSKSLPVSVLITYICVSLSWANGMSSAMKSVSNLFLLAPLPSPSLVYNEIIKHYQCIFSLAWVTRKPCHCWNRHWCHFCHAVIVVPPCTATTQGAWEEQAQASVFVSADSPFRHHVLVVHELSLTRIFESIFYCSFFQLSTKVLMATFEIEIYDCMELAYSRL